jgi:hypothetical protein
VTRGRAFTYLVIFVLASAALFFSAPGRGYWVIDPDAAAYVGLARSLVAGEGYTLQDIPHAKFPPGFPALLAIAIAVTGDPQCYGAMRDLVTICGLATIVLAFAVSRSVMRLSPGMSLLVALATGSSIFLLQYSVAYLRSETAFTVFFLASLLAGERWRESRSFTAAAVAGLLAAGAISIRSAGLAAIAGLVLARLLPRREEGGVCLDLSRSALAQAAIASLLAITPMLAQKYYVTTRSAELGLTVADYGDELFAARALDLTKNVDLAEPKIALFSPAMAQRIHGNLGSLALSLGKFVTNHAKGANLAVGSRSGRMHPGGYALLGLLCLGLVIAVRRGLIVGAVAVAVYLALYAIWPFDQQQRFYQPLAALLLPLLAFGAAPLLRLALRICGSSGGRFALAIAMLVLAGLLATVESDAPSILGRWSKTYAVLVLGTFGAGVALLAAAMIARKRILDLVPRAPQIAAAAFGALGVLWTFSFVSALRDMRLEHAEFDRQRRVEPVAARFERIKTHPELLRLLDVLVTSARPADLVMSDIPKMIHEMTGLPTVPLHFDTARAELILATPRGRPQFLYHSPEIPEISKLVDDYLGAHPGLATPIHRVDLKEGTLTIPLALYRIAE